ncbi:hypothetical protein CDQ84_19630, partial [Clostridium thermosuccinogenes]
RRQPIAVEIAGLRFVAGQRLRLQLGIALKTMGDAPRGDAALKLAVATPRQDENRWLGDYGSPLRDNALK